MVRELIGLRCARRDPPSGKPSEADVLAHVSLFVSGIPRLAEDCSVPELGNAGSRRIRRTVDSKSAVQKAHPQGWVALVAVRPVCY